MTTVAPLLLIFGPQGAGKGTQAEQLAAHLDLEHLSTGALLRQAVSERTMLGLAIKHHIDVGDLVPDDVMLTLVRTHMDRVDGGRGVILDGFPRSIEQASALQRHVTRPVTATIELTVPLEALLDRLLRRRVCAQCGASSIAGHDDIDTIQCRNRDGIASRRSDDTPAIIAHRLELYRRHTQPVLSWFGPTTPSITICGDAPPSEVLARIIAGVTPILDSRHHHTATTNGHHQRPRSVQVEISRTARDHRRQRNNEVGPVRIQTPAGGALLMRDAI